MALMAQPWKHPKTGVYWYRRAVPAALREIIGKREWLRSLGTKHPAEAKRLYPAKAAECEAAFRDARAGLRREEDALTHRDIEAITAAWLERELAAHEAAVNPEDAEGWAMSVSELHDRVSGGDLHDDEPTLAPKSVRRVVKDDMSALMKHEGLVLKEDSDDYEMLAMSLVRRKLAFAAAMAKRASGDWRPIEDLALAPPRRGRVDRSKTLLWAFEEWVKARKPARKTEYEFKRYVEEFGATKLVQEVTAEDVRKFRDKQSDANVTANYIDKKLQALRSVFKWLVKDGVLTANPTVGVGVANLKQDREKKKRDGYTRDEARALLTAARKETGALRWLPWLLAATGARLHEVCQALAADVAKTEGIWALRITDTGEGQGLKAEASRRLVPLHPALIAEGLLEYVNGLPKGSRLLPEASPNKVGNWGAKLGQKYGRWARGMIADKRKVPFRGFWPLIAMGKDFRRVACRRGSHCGGFNCPTCSAKGFWGGSEFSPPLAEGKDFSDPRPCRRATDAPHTSDPHEDINLVWRPTLS